MSIIIKLAAAAIAIAVAATVAAIIAYDRGRAAPRERSIHYALSLESQAPVVTGGLRGVTVTAQPPRYRLRPAPNTAIELGARPSCHYLTWRTIGTATDAR